MAKAADKAYHLVRERIINGDYAPSFRLTEQEIADSSGVSRTPVREALRRLQNEGFIKVSSNQSAVVLDLNEGSVNELFELRALLEPYGAARAALRVTPAGIERLRSLALAQYEECKLRSPGYADRVGDLNSQFHHTIYEIADNRRLSLLLPVLIEAPLVVRTFARYDATELMRSAGHHLEIVAALEAGDSAWAESIMRSHVQAAHHTIQRHLAEQRNPAHLREVGAQRK